VTEFEMAGKLEAIIANKKNESRDERKARPGGLTG
jgi:hypothetical protein